MKPKKIFVLLPDGVGLRNFAFSNFYALGKEKDFQITYWNKTLFDLEDLNYPEFKVAPGKNHFLTDILKNARKHIELNLNIKKVIQKYIIRIVFHLYILRLKMR